MVVFLTRNICRKLRISVISPSQWNMSLVSIIWVIWRREMSTCEGPDFWGLHKNMNCAFLLKVQSCKWYNNKYKWRIHACFTFVKSYKMQLKVFFISVCFTSVFIPTDRPFTATFWTFIEHYLKKDFPKKCFFFNRCLLFVLKPSYICYIICMTVSLTAKIC